MNETNTVLLPDLAAVAAFAAELAGTLRRGDCIALSGDLGAGKTELARALIRTLSNAEAEVPSPTFTLVQTYDVQLADGESVALAHCDLYRLKSAAELEELGLEEALQTGVCVIEWPALAAHLLPPHTLHLALEQSQYHGLRTVRWQPERKGLSRRKALDALLAEWSVADREPLKGDASSRRYVRLRDNHRTAMLMDAPPQDIDIREYTAIARHLHAQGYSAPEIYAQSAAWGFVLTEDLGDALYTRLLAERPEEEKTLYDAAIDVLAAWAADPVMRRPALPLRDYDTREYMREVALFCDWFLPAALGETKAKHLREEYLALWKDLLDKAALPCEIFVHRDYHADNLLWLPERRGTARVGLLDFQDALWGHAAYDLASLLEDARRDLSPGMAEHCLERYLRLAGAAREPFLAAYAVLAAQRNSKIIGIFVRLSQRDGKHGYLAHLPRVWAHLEQDLRHPLLASIREWTQRHVPPHARAVHG